jgi:hypothetical protein
MSRFLSALSSLHVKPKPVCGLAFITLRLSPLHVVTQLQLLTGNCRIAQLKLQLMYTCAASICCKHMVKSACMVWHSKATVLLHFRPQNLAHTRLCMPYSLLIALPCQNEHANCLYKSNSQSSLFWDTQEEKQAKSYA